MSGGLQHFTEFFLKTWWNFAVKSTFATHASLSGLHGVTSIQEVMSTSDGSSGTSMLDSGNFCGFLWWVVLRIRRKFYINFQKKSLSRFEVLSFSDIESVALPWTWSTTSYLLKLSLTHFGVPPWPLQAAGHGPFLEKRIMKQHVNKNKAMRSFMSIWRYVTSRCIDSTWLSLKISEFYLPGISRIRLCGSTCSKHQILRWMDFEPQSNLTCKQKQQQMAVFCLVVGGTKGTPFVKQHKKTSELFRSKVHLQPPNQLWMERRNQLLHSQKTKASTNFN